jgi:catechol 2,3-dioxygenase-like lactoylglutathione lyase family enzyme
MSNKGFSHIGLSTHNLDRTKAFYEDVLGFKAVVADKLNIREGGCLRHVFFDVGRDQLLAFMEPRDVPGVPDDYDPGINRGLGVPAAFYHFAFEAGSEAALADKRDRLRAMGLKVSDIVDHGWAKSIYFRDPNGLSLEYCCLMRDLREEDAIMGERGTVPLAALSLDNNVASALQARGRAANRSR